MFNPVLGLGSHRTSSSQTICLAYFQFPSNCTPPACVLVTLQGGRLPLSGTYTVSHPFREQPSSCVPKKQKTPSVTHKDGVLWSCYLCVTWSHFLFHTVTSQVVPEHRLGLWLLQG